MPAEFALPRPFSARPGGKNLSLAKPVVMGILNRNTDSFYAGSRVQAEHELLHKAEAMLKAGASILDLGVVSSRPGAAQVPETVEEELLLPGLQTLRKAFPDTVLSIDCFRSPLARKAINLGVDLINDISGGSFDPAMPETIGRSGVGYVVMHLEGTFETMHQPRMYPDVPASVLTKLQAGIARARSLGIADVWADPGFGFSKAGSQNFDVLRNLSLFNCLEAPLLVGLSRKSMVYKALGTSAEEALNGTTALHMAALLGGAHILRVHDVGPAMETIRLFCSLCSPES